MKNQEVMVIQIFSTRVAYHSEQYFFDSVGYHYQQQPAKNVTNEHVKTIS